MKNLKSHIMLLACCMALLCGCVREEMDPAFIESNDIALRINGTTAYVHSPLTGQLAYSESRRQFRACNDDMSIYFIFTCNDLPVREEQTVKASLEWRTPSSSGHRNGIRFTVEKINDDGMIWLWNSRDLISVTVQKLD